MQHSVINFSNWTFSFLLGLSEPGMESTFSTTCDVGSVEGKKKSRCEMKFGFPHSHTFFEIHVFFGKGY